MVIQRILVNEKNSFGKSLTIFDQKEILIVRAVKNSYDIFYLSFYFLLVHFFSELKICINGQQLLNLNWQFG